MATARLGLSENVWTATSAANNSKFARTGRSSSVSSGYNSRSHSRASSRSSRRSYVTLMNDFIEEEYIEKSSIWDIREESSDDTRFSENPMAAGVLDDQYLFQSLNSILSGEVPQQQPRSASSSVTNSPRPSI
ncbi:hypothetical protein V2G26_018142 [Clonostachys chloroleuca]|uniref:Uncharacterized protein n=1 Tax=Clonostachys chloroleuca TaxID=1926264 RepID=A0AA35PVR0_9HYPO|nr:unnamed protein product [Clonostachys chloroleuca]